MARRRGKHSGMKYDIPPATIDIWRVVDLLTKEYGGAAAFVAAQRADALLDEGDTEGSAMWRRVVEAVEQWDAGKPPDGTKAQ